MEVDFSGKYLSVDNTKDGAVVTITAEAKFEKSADGSKEIFNIPVDVDGKQKIYSPFDKEAQILAKAWGNETNDWVEKQFKANHVAYQSFGQVKKKIVPEPIKK